MTRPPTGLLTFASPWKRSPTRTTGTADRKIITWGGAFQEAFRWSNLSTEDKNALDADALSEDNALSSDILDFIRGDRSNEHPNGITAGNRVSILGDIHPLQPRVRGAGRATTTQRTATPPSPSTMPRATARVYVGANDGMLHAFDADDGKRGMGLHTLPC